jgi:replicative superfamily II helicase
MTQNLAPAFMEPVFELGSDGAISSLRFSPEIAEQLDTVNIDAMHKDDDTLSSLYRSDLSEEERLVMRIYQTNMANLAMEENIIVWMRTGSGKTLIAALVIKQLQELDRKAPLTSSVAAATSSSSSSSTVECAVNNSFTLLDLRKDVYSLKKFIFLAPQVSLAEQQSEVRNSHSFV